MIVFFSGTGNSRYIAELMADKLGDEIVDAGRYIKARKRARLRSDKPWIFVAPTYGWQLPHIFTKFIHAAEFHGNELAYFVMTCGGDIGDARNGILELCEAKNFQYKGVLEVVMPENYLAMFQVTDEEESKDRLLAAKTLVMARLDMIRNGQAFPKRELRFSDRLKSGPVNTAFYKLFVKANAFYVKDSCVSCGRCEEVCPLNNIRLVEGKPQWGSRCTHCMACISNCPAEAIEYGKKSVGKRRYLCEEYKKE